MNRLELRNLKTGDRVRWTKDGTTGVVTEKRYGFAAIVWADGIRELIGWRSADDRARGKNMELICDPQPSHQKES